MKPPWMPWGPALAMACPIAAVAGQQLSVQVDGMERVFYQAEPLSVPRGGDAFKGSNFIHPLKTPSGFIVTDSQPDDHLHHFGVWWPWKYIEYNDRKVLCWELQKGDGIVRATHSEATDHGFIAHSEYVDRKAADAPATVLKETVTASVSDVVDQPARGYFLDLNISQRTAGKAAVTVSSYRYSGFALRGAAGWDRHTSTLLTSEGHGRDTANFTRARWVRVEGEAAAGATAGVLLMSRADNHGHPEKLRTWDTQHEGRIFINFNPVMDAPWILEPNTAYARQYRLFIYDGALPASAAETLWKSYQAAHH